MTQQQFANNTAAEQLQAGAELGAFFGLHLGTAIMTGWPKRNFSRTLDAESQIEALDLVFNANHSLGRDTIAQKVTFIGVRVDPKQRRMVLTVQYEDMHTDISFSLGVVDWGELHAHMLREYQFGSDPLSKEAFVAALPECTLKLAFPN